jgi:predicted porin
MKKITLAILLGLFFLVSGFAQESNKFHNNNEVWIGFTLKKEVSNHVTLSFDQQTRTMDNLQGIRANLLELGLKYELSKHFSVKGQYRYTFRNNMKNTKRISLDISTKWKYKPAKLTFKYRLRLQNTVVSYTRQNLTLARSRFSLQYKISKKWGIYTEYESFFRFNEKNEFRGNRYTVGTKYKLTKQMELNAFYQVDQEINVKSPVQQNIYGLLLQWNLK